ncbi:MAG: hypothetical protein JWM62_1693 [Frankiales bacterium]|nr:hypothetical protein [Frankiales bacterium]
MTNAVANPLLVVLLKSRAGVVLGRRLAVVEYVGRRTGRTHQLVVLYRLDDGLARVQVGMPDRKQWWHNFTTPRAVTLHLAGHQHRTLAHAVRHEAAVEVVAEVVQRHGDQVPEPSHHSTA